MINIFIMTAIAYAIIQEFTIGVTQPMPSPQAQHNHTHPSDHVYDSNPNQKVNEDILKSRT